jgi:hypothetical protein
VSAGTIGTTCAILASLIRGAVHDRETIANAFGMELASADRYIRTLVEVPGVVSLKQGRRRTLRWYFTDAIKAAGL